MESVIHKAVADILSQYVEPILTYSRQYPNAPIAELAKSVREQLQLSQPGVTVPMSAALQGSAMPGGFSNFSTSAPPGVGTGSSSKKTDTFQSYEFVPGTCGYCASRGKIAKKFCGGKPVNLHLISDPRDARCKNCVEKGKTKTPSNNLGPVSGIINPISSAPMAGFNIPSGLQPIGQPGLNPTGNLSPMVNVPSFASSLPVQPFSASTPYNGSVPTGVQGFQPLPTQGGFQPLGFQPLSTSLQPPQQQGFQPLPTPQPLGFQQQQGFQPLPTPQPLGFQSTPQQQGFQPLPTPQPLGMQPLTQQASVEAKTETQEAKPEIRVFNPTGNSSIFFFEDEEYRNMPLMKNEQVGFICIGKVSFTAEKDEWQLPTNWLESLTEIKPEDSEAAFLKSMDMLYAFRHSGVPSKF